MEPHDLSLAELCKEYERAHGVAVRAGPGKTDSRLSEVSVLITAPARGENLRTEDETKEKKSLGRLQGQGGPGGAEGRQDADGVSGTIYTIPTVPSQAALAVACSRPGDKS